MAFDSSVGGSASNSFGSLAEAEAYAAEHPYATEWDALATDAAKEALLIHATRGLVAGVCLQGTAATSTQALPFPRLGLTTRNGYALSTTIVPLDIKHAQFEYALTLARSGNVLLAKDQAVEGLTELRAGPVTLKFREDLVYAPVPANVLAMIPPGWLCEEVKPMFQLVAL